MTNTQHTPGPWDYDGYVIDENDRVIADVFINDDENWQERNSNGRLIAAAPELLDALKELVESAGWLFYSIHRGTMDKPMRGWPDLTRARAAIAKATGSTAET